MVREKESEKERERRSKVATGDVRWVNGMEGKHRM